MKAIVFAAGLGTRLKPLTEKCPKALVEVNGMPMLEIAIRKLKNAGVDQIIINLHHHGEQIRDFIKRNNYFGIEIDFSDETDLLLDTGGGLKKAKWFLDGISPFFAYNVDILTDLDLHAMAAFHQKNQPIATLAVKEREGNRFFLFSGDQELCGWKNVATGEEKIVKGQPEKLFPLAFSGIHLIDPSIFDIIEEDGVFSIVDVYLRLSESHLIKGFVHNQSIWMDLGKPEKVLEGERAIKTYGLERFINP